MLSFRVSAALCKCPAEPSEMGFWQGGGTYCGTYAKWASGRESLAGYAFEGSLRPIGLFLEVVLNRYWGICPVEREIYRWPESCYRSISLDEQKKLMIYLTSGQIACLQKEFLHKNGRFMEKRIMQTAFLHDLPDFVEKLRKSGKVDQSKGGFPWFERLADTQASSGASYVINIIMITQCYT